MNNKYGNIVWNKAKMDYLQRKIKYTLTYYLLIYLLQIQRFIMHGYKRIETIRKIRIKSIGNVNMKLGLINVQGHLPKKTCL